MGNGDRRKSRKMVQRHSRAHYKARMKRGPGPARAPSPKPQPPAAVDEDRAEEPAAAGDEA